MDTTPADLPNSIEELRALVLLQQDQLDSHAELLDCAIVDGLLQLISSEIEHYWRTGESRGAGATYLTGRHPWYGVHATGDGGAVAVGAVELPFSTTRCAADSDTLSSAKTSSPKEIRAMLRARRSLRRSRRAPGTRRSPSLKTRMRA